MSFNNFISENILLPLGDCFTGQTISKTLRFLMKSQYWTREEIDSYQNSRLRSLITHAYKNVPFYYELFKDMGVKPEDIQTKDDLLKLPVITKNDLKRAKSKHLAKNIHKKNLVYCSSSGSTAEPFQYYSTREAESFLTASAIRAWYWMGYRLGDRYVKVSMNPRNSKIKKLQDMINNCTYVSSNQLDGSEFERISEKIFSTDPLFLRCYPVPLLFLARQIKEENINYEGKRLIAINTTGSTLHNNVRKEIEDIFNVRIFDSYSCEGGAVFSQCSENSYYHPAEEYAISEFLEDTVTVSDPEKPYRHITTDLHNYASPFIRYDTQDYIVLAPSDRCTCGRSYLNIKKIKGRDGDILRTPSGKLLIVENFVAYFEWIKEVEKIQVIQNKKDEIIIKMVVNDLYTDEIGIMIEDYWKEYIGNDVRLALELVEDVELTKAGKLRTVIRNPEISLQ